jgi:hypothetical protein
LIFLSEYPLYKKWSIDELYANLNQMKQQSFQGYCDTAKTFKPFLTDIHKSIYEPLSSRLIQGALWILKNMTKEYDFTETYSATCQHCQEFKAYFTIHGVGTRSKDGTNSFYMRKLVNILPCK